MQNFSRHRKNKFHIQLIILGLPDSEKYHCQSWIKIKEQQSHTSNCTYQYKKDMFPAIVMDREPKGLFCIVSLGCNVEYSKTP